MAPDSESLSALKIERPAHAPRSSRWPLLAAIVVLLLLVVGGVNWWQRPRAIEVAVTPVHASSDGIQRILLNASGYVTARRRATVSSKVTGRVVEVLIEEGMQVEEGQLLARLDATNVESTLRLSEAQLESTRRILGETEALLAQAERMRVRNETLGAARMITEAELERSQADAAALRARLERQRADIVVAQRQVDLRQQQVDDTAIRAPFAGVVISKNAQPGEMISPNSAGGGFTRTGICTIVDMASLEVEVDVNESYINRVQAGQAVVVTLDSYPDWRIPSTVIAIIPTADRQKATVRVRIGFEALDDRILPDMGLKVAFQSVETEQDAPSQNFLLVPRRAVQRVGTDEIVWVVRDSTVERRAITTGISHGDKVTVIAGLAAGESVVLAPPPGLADGTEVTTKSP